MDVESEEQVMANADDAQAPGSKTNASRTKEFASGDGSDPAEASESASPSMRASLIADAAAKLWELQSEDGHIVFELEADCTIPSEYVLLYHFLGEPKTEAELKIGAYLRRIQGDDGGWPLFHGGDADLSATIKAYWALKLIGDDIDTDHMRRAREKVLAMGGAAKANVFTRFALALFGQIPWRGAPTMPVEIMLLPQWFPFHISKISYWSRTVITPLLILASRKARAVNPTGKDIRELFVTPPEEQKIYNTNPTGSLIGDAFLRLDKFLRWAEPRLFPKKLRARAEAAAERFFVERLNGEDGLGAIFPAMANSVMAMRVLGYPEDHPAYATAKKSIDLLLIEKENETYCQPCVSPIWDTGLAAHALMEAGAAGDDPKLKAALDWLLSKEIRDVKGDWIFRRPYLKPAGWAFQYANDYYPDVDDTAVVGMVMHRTGDPKYTPAIWRAADWILGMQSSNGGWGAFDPENEHYYLNSIPFADHGALLDPPTEDVTARCISFLAQIGYAPDHPAILSALNYLKREQQPDGSWWGRWGANYIYGAWSVLCALNAIGEDPSRNYIRRAVQYLKNKQAADGGWGEDLDTYWEDKKDLYKASTASQTAWALLGLMAAGEADSEAVKRGIAFLMRSAREGARWKEEYYTGTGFPRVFYLKYHGYAAYFPLWALSRYQNLSVSKDKRVIWGM